MHEYTKKQRLHLSTAHMLPLNVHVFDTLTDEVLYWSGLLMADGCVCGNNLVLSLSGEDGTHVRRFRRFIGSGCSIQHPRPTKWSKSKIWRLSVRSMALVSVLHKLGIVPRKSLIARATPAQRQSAHFWRGYLDGNGHLGFSGKRPRLMVAGSNTIIKQFSDFVRRLWGKKAGCLRPLGKISRYDLVCRAARAVIKSCYGIDGPVLPRKARMARVLVGA